MVHRFFSRQNLAVLLSAYVGAVRAIRRGAVRTSMAAPRNLIGETGRLLRDEESAVAKEDDDSPTGKRPKLERFPFTRWELAGAFGVFFVFSAGLFCIYSTMPAADFRKLKLPRTLSDLRILKCVRFPICSFRFSFAFLFGNISFLFGYLLFFFNFLLGSTYIMNLTLVCEEWVLKLDK